MLPWKQMLSDGHTLDFTETERIRLSMGLVKDDSTGCLVWTGALGPFGYGYMGFRGETWRTHRLAWLMAGLDIPPDKPCVLHNCNNPPCCNVEHLRVGTKKDNLEQVAREGRGRVSLSGMPRGVRRVGNRYAAYVHVDRKQAHLGMYDSVEEAVLGRAEKIAALRISLCGE